MVKSLKYIRSSHKSSGTPVLVLSLGPSISQIFIQFSSLILEAQVGVVGPVFPMHWASIALIRIIQNYGVLITFEIWAQDVSIWTPKNQSSKPCPEFLCLSFPKMGCLFPRSYLIKLMFLNDLEAMGLTPWIQQTGTPGFAMASSAFPSLPDPGFSLQGSASWQICYTSL